VNIVALCPNSQFINYWNLRIPDLFIALIRISFEELDERLAA
jgi:hypothetical protein